jgi:hypothetical protein
MRLLLSTALLVCALAACDDPGATLPPDSDASPEDDGAPSDATTPPDTDALVPTDGGVPPPPRLEVVDQLGGVVGTAVADGTQVIAGVGWCLAVYDLTDPRAPVELDRTPPLGGHVHDVAVAGSRVLAAAGAGGLAIFEKTPAGLVRTGTWLPPSLPLQEAGVWAVAAEADGPVYVSAGEQVFVLDVSTPATPSVLATIPLGHTALNLAVAGERLLVGQRFAPEGASRALDLFDVHDPATPGRVGTTSVAGDVYDIALRGTRAYVATNGALLVVDLPEDAAPVVVGALPGGWLSVDVTPAVELLATRMYEGTFFVDIANPAAPKIRATLLDETYGIGGAIAVGAEALVWTEREATSYDVRPGMEALSVPTLVPGTMRAWNQVATDDHLVVQTADGLESYALPLAGGAPEATLAITFDARLAAIHGLVAMPSTSGLRLFDPAHHLAELPVPAASTSSPRYQIAADETTGRILTFTSGGEDPIAQVDGWQVVAGEVQALGVLGEVPFSVGDVALRQDLLIAGSGERLASFDLSAGPWAAPLDVIEVPSPYGNASFVLEGPIVYRTSCVNEVDRFAVTPFGQLTPLDPTDGFCNPPHEWHDVVTSPFDGKKLLVGPSFSVLGGLALLDIETGAVVTQMPYWPIVSLEVRGHTIYAASAEDGLLVLRIVQP